MQTLTLDEVSNLAPSVNATAPHSGVSGRYKFMSTSKVLTRLYDNGFSAVKVMENNPRKDEGQGFQKHLIRLRHESVIEAKGHVPEIVLINSHDRTSSFKLLLGVFRMVCSNGMVVGHNVMGFSRRHMGSLSLRAIRGIISRFGKMSDNLNNTIEVMSARILNPEERMVLSNQALTMRLPNLTNQIRDYVLARLPEGASASDRIQQIRDEVANRTLFPKRDEDAGNDLWRTFNVLQENSMQGFYNPVSGRRLRPIRNIHQDIDLNVGLWTAAQSFISSN